MNKLLALAEGAAMVVSQQKLSEIGYRRSETQIDPKKDNHNLHTLSYFGLPYQDHNYGAPPPPTPPQSPPHIMSEPVLSVVDPPSPEGETPLGVVEELVSPDDPDLATSGPKKEGPESSEEEREEEDDEADELNQDEGITRCICDFEHDDGYMICCDKCLVWQHVECMGLDRSNIPDNYFCEMCEPRLVDVATAKILQGKKKKHLEELQRREDLSNEGKTTASSPKGRKKVKKKKKRKEKDREKEDENKRRDRKRRRRDRERGDSTTSVASDDNPRSDGNESDTAHQDDSSSKEASLIQCTPELEELVAEYRRNPEMFLAGAATYHGPPEEMSRTKVCIGQVSKGEVNGVVTLEAIPANQPIMQLSGTLSLLDEERKNSQLGSFMFVYSSFCNTELVLNAGSHDNKARFIRKSCSPNAEIRHMIVDGEVQLYTFALKDISDNTEVTLGFDYDFTLGQHPVKCACGKKNCPVKKFWHKHKSNGFKQKTNNNQGDVKLNSPVKKTVSPLKITLNKQTSQETLPKVADGPKPIESSKSEPVTPQGKLSSSSEETSEAKPLHKMTREERKMDAIMKAFERLEKMQQRRAQTQGRLAKDKPQLTAAKTGGSDSPEQTKQGEEREPEEKQEEQEPTDGKEEVEEKEKEVVEKKTEEKDEVNVTEQEELPVPQVEVKPKPRVLRKRRRASSCRRRSRNSSGASTVSIEVLSADDDATSSVNQSSCPSVTTEVAPTLTSTPVATVQASAAVSPAQPPAVASTPSSSLLSVQTNPLPETKTDPPLASPAANSKHFKFPKTKRFFMNEWLNEQAQEASADSPLTVKTENFDVPTLNSPNAAAPRERATSLDVSFGSAKKRWLRQAMQETSQPGSNGSNSPVCNGGGASPITPSPAVSPNSNSADFMTPLKKRLLRHSLSEEKLSHLKPELASEDSTTSVDQSLLTIKEEKAEDKSEESPPKNVSFHLSLPAKKEMRKNSSLDSGLSVTTPADFDSLPSFPAINGSGGEAAAKKLTGKEEAKTVIESEKEGSPPLGQGEPTHKVDVDPALESSSISGLSQTSASGPTLGSAPTSSPATELRPVVTLSTVPTAATPGSTDAPRQLTDVAITTPTTTVMGATVISKSLKRCLSDEASFANGEINPAYFSPKKRHLYLRQNTDPGTAAPHLGASWPRPGLARSGAPADKEGPFLSQSWSGSGGDMSGRPPEVPGREVHPASPGHPQGFVPPAAVAHAPAGPGFMSPAQVGHVTGLPSSLPPGSERLPYPSPPEAIAYPPYPGQPHQEGGHPTPVLAEEYLASPKPAASVSAPTTPSKKRVSLLEYRKRKSVSTTKKTPEKPEATAAAEESTAVSPEAKAAESSPTSSTADSPPEKPAKAANIITFKDKKFPLAVDGGATTGMNEGGLQSLPLFSKKPIAELDGGKKLTLTDEAHKLITSLTEVLMEGKSPAPKPPARVPEVVNSAIQEDPLQRMRRELNEKNKEKVMALKRAHSPEPPPPPPEKKMRPEEEDGGSSPVPPPPPPRNAPPYGQALHSPKGGGLKIANHVVVNPPGFTPVQQIVPQTNGGHMVYPAVMAGNPAAPQYPQQPAAVKHSPRGSQQQHHQPIAAQLSPRGSQQPMAAKHSPRGLYSPAPAASTSPRGARPHPNNFQYNNHAEEPLVPVPTQGAFPNYNNGGDHHYQANTGGGQKISPTSYTNSKYPLAAVHDKRASPYSRNSLSPRRYQRH